MIIKSFELTKINNLEHNLFLLYGQNEGFKNEIIKKIFISKFKENVFRYDEKEILDKKSDFFNGIFSKSFFEENKLFIISRVTDKLFDIIEEILEKKISDIKIILNAQTLEKKSKLRKLFEKNEKTICIPVYEDNIQTLNTIAREFFKLNKIPISQEIINLIVERSRGDRRNLNNELGKIEAYMKTNKNINSEEILKLTNLAENYNVSELLNNCLSKNSKKTMFFERLVTLSTEKPETKETPPKALIVPEVMLPANVVRLSNSTPLTWIKSRLSTAFPVMD